MTNRYVTTIASWLTIATLVLGAAWIAAPPQPAASEDGISVFFSPNGGCTEAIVHEIDGAQNTILVQAYSFTSAPLADALLRAHNRGVQVSVVLDSSQQTEKYSSATFFSNQGIDLRIDAAHAIAHNKVMLIDNRTIVTGSFNFTKAAEERNAENVLIIQDKPDLVRAYLTNFNEHRAHSAEYAGPRGDAPPAPQVGDDQPSLDDAANRVTVHVTATGTKYHMAGCRYLSKSDTPISLKDAKRRGLTPCSVCHPPG